MRIGKAPRDGAAPGDDARTRTLRIDTENGDSIVAEGGTRTRGTRLQNVIVDSNTRLALSHIFDSSAAIKRLTKPDPKDHARLTRAPQPPNIFTQFWHDAELRLLGWCVVAAMVAGFIVAIY
ncbi:MAG: hypothetical protein ACT4PQ_02695 [Betaproteobacteria bacterium]